MASDTILPFPWYGGKYNHLNFILDNLPTDTERYIEPYGGSAVVLLNRDPVPMEVYNDIDGELTNFFQVLRSDYEDFIHRMQFMPHSRRAFERACNEEPEDAVQRALFFFVRTAQAYNGVQGGSWARSVGITRRGMPQRTAAWDSRKEQVERTAERIMQVQIENRPALDIMQRFDDADATIYCDPPYPPESRESTGQYNFEMDADAHRELASVASECDSHVAISSYGCDLIDEIYEDWYVTDGETKTLAGEGTGDRTEILITNYDPETV